MLTRATIALVSMTYLLVAPISMADDKSSSGAGDTHSHAAEGTHGHAAEGSHATAREADGKHLSHRDERTAIRLSAGERNFILHEMRGFLVSVHGIVDAIAADNPGKAAEHARASGMGATHDVPPEMMRKMPSEWRTLGRDTHIRFDALALEATGMGDGRQILRQLSETLANCTSCHAAYRLVVE